MQQPIKYRGATRDEVLDFMLQRLAEFTLTANYAPTDLLAELAETMELTAAERADQDIDPAFKRFIEAAITFLRSTGTPPATALH